MKDTALELYIYLNSKDHVIKHLESKGITTKQEAIEYLQPYVSSNIADVLRIGKGTSLVGTAQCVEHVVKHFAKKKS